MVNDLNDYDATNALDGNGGGVNGAGQMGGGLASSDRLAYVQGYGGWDVEGVELSDEFKQQYEKWLQHEVFNNQIDWDVFINNEF